jgi:hypothetical protein
MRVLGERRSIGRLLPVSQNAGARHTLRLPAHKDGHPALA